MYFTRRGDSSYAAELLTHARSLFEFADEHRGVYTNAISDAGGFYNSWSGYEDELMWSAAWMALATGESSYADKAEDFYNQFDELQGLPSEFSWDDKTAGGQLLLYQLTENSRYKNNVQVNVRENVDQKNESTLRLPYLSGLPGQHPSWRLHPQGSCLDKQLRVG